MNIYLNISMLIVAGWTIGGLLLIRRAKKRRDKQERNQKIIKERIENMIVRIINADSRFLLLAIRAEIYSIMENYKNDLLKTQLWDLFYFQGYIQGRIQHEFKVRVED